MPSFLASSVGVAVLALALTLVIFFLIPRVGRTFLSLRGPLARRQPGSPIGWSWGLRDDPDRSDHRDARELSRGPRGAGPVPDLRWRGLAYDRFDGRAWSQTDPERRPARQGREGFYVITPFMVGMPFLTAEVFLEPMGTDVLFAPPHLRALQTRLPALNVDVAGGVMLPLPPTSRVRYLAISQPERMREEALRRPVRATDYPPEIRKIYLQLPALSPRVRAWPSRLRRERGRRSRWSAGRRRICRRTSGIAWTSVEIPASTRWRISSSSGRRGTANTSPRAW